MDNWLAGAPENEFKDKHPEAGGKLSADFERASSQAAGKRLARYEVTGSRQTPNGYRFSVSVTIDDRGTAETKLLHYDVFKDRTLGEGRWTILSAQ
jgi:hypothetical protein